MLDPWVQKMLNERSHKPQTPEEIVQSQMDMPTLQAGAAVAVSVGFQHFELSKDTRLDLQARRAHKFVSMNCETIARKMLSMSGLPPEQIEEMLEAIMAQTAQFRKAQEKKT